MKVTFGVLLCVYAASAAVYIDELERFLGDLPVTKFDFPSFVDRTYTAEENSACLDARGEFVDGSFIGNSSHYNVLEILKALGGAPGEVEAPRRKEVSDPAVEVPSKRPLEDAPEDKWLYDFRATDYKYYFRLEHGVKRFAGTENEFLDIRGRVAWLPEDTCGSIKVADYYQDDTGFHAEVSHDYCHLKSNKYFSCASIAYCATKPNGGRICVG